MLLLPKVLPKLHPNVLILLINNILLILAVLVLIGVILAGLSLSGP
jgi:hypothetical protein